MARYAAATEVSSDRSKAEIERLLTRYGADAFMFGWSGAEAQIAFRMHGRHIRFRLQMPSKEDFRHTPSRQWERSDKDMLASWEQACRQRWRALALIIKAKLEAIESGITDFETEMLAYTLLPNGETAAEWAAPQIERAYSTGEMPTALPAVPLLTGGK